MKKRDFLRWLILGIALAINVFIIVNAFINGEASAKESTSIAQTTADIINDIKEDTITPEKFPTFAYYFRKAIGHFALFASSGLFSSWALYLFIGDRKIGYFAYELGMSLTFGFALACISELCQKFTDGRVGAWTDVGIDMMGYALGLILVFLVLLIMRSKIYKYQKEK